MARGTQLQSLVAMLRAEAGHSAKVNLGVDHLDTLKIVLRRTQETLYHTYDWPFLRVMPFKELNAGQRYYDLPPELDLERVEKVAVYYGGIPHPVLRGIDFEDYASYDSDADMRADPVLKWDVRSVGNDEMIEVWPVPIGNGMRLQWRGLRALRPLVADGDVADLDDQLIVLFAAAEMLARQKSVDAELKLSAARERLTTLKARSQGGSETITYGGFGDSRRGVRHRSVIRVGS